MLHFLTVNEKCRDLIYDDDYPSYLTTRANSSSDYSFGRTQGKRVRVRAALSCVDGYLKDMIEAIANAKLRRMEREREFRGMRLDPSCSNWVARKSRATERSRG